MELDPHGGPIETDCTCGNHYVLDPAEINAFLARRKFKCVDCGRRKFMADVGALIAGQPLTAICLACDRQYGESDSPA